MSNKLEQLRAITDVVADTGDIDAIRLHKPLDATTNPSLLLAAAKMENYAPLVTQALAESDQADTQAKVAAAADRLAVKIGCEILGIIPGRISTEVDARLSFDTQATVTKALQLVDLYDKAGVSRERILIKIASTWEGIKAAEILEKEGINCNLTLLFSFAQAAACADAGAFLISPFVGRILDWHKAQGNLPATIDQDPGVVSVRSIYDYYKTNGYDTVVMGASFRSKEQIEALAGCDRLTISPALLSELAADTGALEAKLDAKRAKGDAKQAVNEINFRWQMNEDAMATEKLAEGIRKFAQDQVALETLLANWK